MNRLLLPIAVLAAGVLVGGCGSSSKSTQTPAGTGVKELPSAEFVRKADAICKATEKKLEAEAGPGPPSDLATATKAQLSGLGHFLTVRSQGLDDQLNQLNALGEPREPAAKKAWRELHSLLDTKGIPALKNAADDARKGDVDAFHADVRPLSTLDAPLTKLERIVGLKVCGQR